MERVLFDDIQAVNFDAHFFGKCLQAAAIFETYHAYRFFMDQNPIKMGFKKSSAYITRLLNVLKKHYV